MKLNTLTPEEERVIVHKGTEMPYSGAYNSVYEKGTYHCKRCHAPLYHMTSSIQAVAGPALMMRYKEPSNVKPTVMADAPKSSATPVVRT